MRCRKLSECEIGGVFANSEKALVSVGQRCNTRSREMCASAVKINGSYRLTLEGNVCSSFLNALASGESVTVKYSGRNCCGTYCVTAAGVPDGVTLDDCGKVTFTLSDFISDGVMRF